MCVEGLELEKECLSLTVFSLCQLLLMSKEIDVRELDFLLRFNIDHSYISPLDFLSNSAWSAIKVHKDAQDFFHFFCWMHLDCSVNEKLLLPPRTYLPR